MAEINHLSDIYDLWKSEDGRTYFEVRNEMGHIIAEIAIVIKQKPGGIPVSTLFPKTASRICFAA